MNKDELPELPGQHKELSAFWECDSCAGCGHSEEVQSRGDFQPPEPWPCLDCGATGHIKIEAYTADQMREYALAALAAVKGEGETLKFVLDHGLPDESGITGLFGYQRDGLEMKYETALDAIRAAMKEVAP